MRSLLDSISVLGLSLKNRVVMAPLTRGRAGDSRVPNALMANYYAQRASAGLIIAEATAISAEGYGWVGAPGIYTPEMMQAWQPITAAVHERGGKMVLQLWHMGRASHSDFHEGNLPLAPSAVAIRGGEIYTPAGKKAYEVPRAMTLADIERTLQDYRQAAEFALLAGFDGVEVHAANGYLINQFLDSTSNLRDDAYGGSVENRYRFLAEALAAVASVWPMEKIGVRLSPNGVFNDMGHAESLETYRYVAAQLEQLKIGYLHVMDGLAFGFHQQSAPMTLQDFRSVFSGVLIGNCGYSVELAEQSVANEFADMIAFGRPYITNPDLVERIAHRWPLNPSDDTTHWYGGAEQGYTDYAPYQPSAQ